jgi:hypothetical protein
VLRERILKDNHVEEFRQLGRGWIFVWLRRPKKEFKFWFESVKRIEHDHQMDLRALNLHGEKLNKHTYGYLFQSEMVFFIKVCMSVAALSIGDWCDGNCLQIGCDARLKAQVLNGWHDRVCVCVCVCMYVSMYVCMYACMYVGVYVPRGLYVCVYVCMCVCMYLGVCMCVCLSVCRSDATLSLGGISADSIPETQRRVSLA